MEATLQLFGVGKVDDKWLCYTMVWEELLSNEDKTACSSTPSLSFLVEEATSIYQLVIIDDDCGIFIVCTGYQGEDLPHTP